MNAQQRTLINLDHFCMIFNCFMGHFGGGETSVYEVTR